jgi:hypothetical protein
MSRQHTIIPAVRNPATCASDAADRRFQRDVTALYQRGPRAVAAAFRHLGATSFRQTEIEQVVARFAAVDPELLRFLGGDRFPPYPDLRLVRGRHD